MFGTYGNVAPHLKVGTLRALAVANGSRAECLPDVPTLAEEGYGHIDADAWFGAFARAHTPEQVTSALDGLLNTALKDSAVKEKSRSLSGRHMRCGLCRLSQKTTRGIQPHHRRGQYQGRIGSRERLAVNKWFRVLADFEM